MADTKTNPVNQEKRKENLLKLVDIFHRDKYGDYEDTYAEFASQYGLPQDEEDAASFDPEDGVEAIPRYASVAEDETYGMIRLFDTMREALRDHAGISSNGEYLNVPAGIYDLDKDEHPMVPMMPIGIMLTPEMAALLPRLIEDAIYYRESDDEDEDGENDNKQADKYREILELIEQD